MVYVDNPVWALGRMKMGHMIADSTEELLVMAVRIGVDQKYLQFPGTWREHFDICKRKRALAVKAGAMAMSTRELVRKMKGRKMINEKKFPRAPPYRGQWAPVYMEPIMGSGERITVGIVVVSDVEGGLGLFACRMVLDPQKLEVLWGEAGQGFVNMAQFAVDDLTDYLSGGILEDDGVSRLKAWRPALSGVELGEIRPFAAHTLEDAFGIGIRQTAAFALDPRENKETKRRLLKSEESCS